MFVNSFGRYIFYLYEEEKKNYKLATIQFKYKEKISIVILNTKLTIETFNVSLSLFILLNFIFTHIHIYKFFYFYGQLIKRIFQFIILIFFLNLYIKFKY